MIRRTVLPPLFATMIAVSSSAAAGVEIAVTVDDLPTAGPLPRGISRLEIATRMIETLRAAGVPAYGFVNAGQIGDDAKHELILRVWREAGLLLGNHTFSHADLNRLGASEYLADIARNESLLERLAPRETWKYFRYPYLHEGNTLEKRRAVRRWLASRGYTIAPVTVDFDDSVWNDAYGRCTATGDHVSITRLRETFIQAATTRLAWARETAARIFNRPIKHILLIHMGAFTALMADDLLRTLQANGGTFIRLDAALSDPAYRVTVAIAWENSRTYLLPVAEVMQVRVPPVPMDAIKDAAAVCR